MLGFLLVTALYFLPSIIGRDKRDFTGIFLFNLLLGWTVVGWVVAFFWACSSDRPAYQQYAPAGLARFCSQCGAPAVSVVQYCGACGTRI